jgi:hypothetical protein
VHLLSEIASRVLVHHWHSRFLVTLGRCHHLEGLEIWWIIEHLVEVVWWIWSS